MSREPGVTVFDVIITLNTVMARAGRPARRRAVAARVVNGARIADDAGTGARRAPRPES
jgi:hypothetical protein